MDLNEYPNRTPILDQLLPKMDTSASQGQPWERQSGLEEASAKFNRLKPSLLKDSLTRQDLEIELEDLMYEGERIALLIWLKKIHKQHFENTLNK